MVYGYYLHPCDNACIESLHSVLKKEERYLYAYQDSAEAHRAIFEYIEGWSAIGYMTSQQKEDEELKTAVCSFAFLSKVLT